MLCASRVLQRGDRVSTRLLGPLPTTTCAKLAFLEGRLGFNPAVRPPENYNLCKAGVFRGATGFQPGCQAPCQLQPMQSWNFQRDDRASTRILVPLPTITCAKLAFSEGRPGPPFIEHSGNNYVLFKLDPQLTSDGYIEAVHYCIRTEW